MKPSPSADWTLWQLVDSAFPTGGFAHSGGLEAAWQHGELRNRHDLISYLEVSLLQVVHGSAPFVIECHRSPDRAMELDELCDAFLSNHVANRASRLQGRALAAAMEKIFQVTLNPGSGTAATATTARPELRHHHFPPAFGALARRLDVGEMTTMRLHLYNHLRGLLAAAVRLNIVGPMEAQQLQHRLASQAEALCERCARLTLDDLAQTAPLIDLWQGAQDRLYSRLFQS